MRRQANDTSANRRTAGWVDGFVRGGLLLICVLISALWVRPATATPLASEAALTSTLHVAVGKSAPLRIVGDVRKIVVSQPEIVQVDTAGSGELYVIGQDIGAANLLIYGADDRLTQVVNVEVGFDGAQLQDDIDAVLPDENITVQTLSGGLLLRGSATSAQAAALAGELAQRAAGADVISLVDVRPDQVLLEVQLVEASEDDLRDIGIGLEASSADLLLRTGSAPNATESPHSVLSGAGKVAGHDLSGALRALEQRGAAHVLARPRLLALSGEKASFRAGGEFPYPVPTRDGVTIEFKPYGTSLAVVPTVQANGMIRLDLTAEVSSIDPRNSVQIEGLTVPALNTRRATTRLNLRDGETLMFAGLYSASELRDDRATPWAGDLPVVGTLFKAVRTRTQRTQLAIFVTARVVGQPDASQTFPETPDELTPSTAATAETIAKHKPGRLKALIRSSPLANAVSRRLTTVFNTAVDAPRTVMAGIKALSRRILTAVREGRPGARLALSAATSSADS